MTPPSSLRTRRLQPFLAMVMGLVATLAMVEIGLRLGGVAFDLDRAVDDAAIDDAAVVLCIGESTTAFGGEDAYPRQLESMLHGHPGGPWRVINAGEPGRDTSAILARLDDRLARYQPWAVVAMMGANDSPETGAIPADFTGARARWGVRSLRTVRLLRLLWHQRARGGWRQTDPEGAGQTLAPNPAVLILDEIRQDLEAGRADRARSSLRPLVAAVLRGEQPHQELSTAVLHDRELAAGGAEEVAASGEDLAHSRQGLQRVAAGGGAVGSHDEAERALVRALEAEPLGSWAADPEGPLIWLLRLLAEQGRDEELHRWLERYHAAVPGDARPLAIALGEAERLGQHQRAVALGERAAALRTRAPNPSTRARYRALHARLRDRGIHLVVASYPRRDRREVDALVEGLEGVTVVDNGPVFEQAVEQHGFEALFTDRCYGDFGHGSPLGNRILAENIAHALRALPAPPPRTEP